MLYGRIENLECLEHKVTSIGFIIKSSKLVHQWTFIYKGRFHEVKLFHSKYSSNKEVLIDDQVVYLKQKTAQLSIGFKVDDIEVSIVQFGDEYDLRLNSCSFSHLLECEKNKRYFDHQEMTSIVKHNKPSDDCHKQINNALPLSDFTKDDSKEEGRRQPLFSFCIHSANENPLTQRLM